MPAPSTLSQILLLFAGTTSALTVLGHTKMGYDLVFPSLKKCGPKDKGALSAKIGWLEVNTGFVIICTLIFSSFVFRCTYHCFRLCGYGVSEMGEKDV
jgi:hypothetical protein